MAYIVKLVHKALSDADIQRILGADAKIINYSDLDNYTSLNQLLPRPLDFCIILYEDRLDHGHWIALSKYNGIFEYFDSYGNKPDKPLEWANMKMRKRLEQVVPYLSQLLSRERYIYNHIKYQERGNFVNTCGSHVVHRLYRLKNNGMGLDKYYNLMHTIKKELDVDIIVAEFMNGLG